MTGLVSMIRYCLCVTTVAVQFIASQAADWYVDDWYLKGGASFSYPIVNVLPGDSILFEWNVSIHGMNDVWIYPSQECDEDIGAVLVSYTSPAVYNFTEADAGKVMFFVNSVGIRCKLGVSLYANVSENVLADGEDADTVASSANETTADSSIFVVVNETAVNETLDDAAVEIGGVGNSVAIGIESSQSTAPKDEEASSNAFKPSSLLNIIAMITCKLLTA